MLELLGGAVVIHDGLVTDDQEHDNIPFAPRNELVNLLLDIGSIDAATRALDKDTDNHLHAILGAGIADILQGVAVSRVDSDHGETGILDGRNIRVDLVGRLALTSGANIGSVGHSQVVIVADQIATGVVRGWRSLGALGSLRGLGGRRGSLGLLGSFSGLDGGRGRSLGLDRSGSRGGS